MNILDLIMPTIFLAGIVCIAMEDKLKINKAAIATGMAIILWSLILIDIEDIASVFNPEYLRLYVQGNPSLATESLHSQAISYISDFVLIDRLGEVATTIFFVMATMVIIELIDNNGGFYLITRKIKTRDKRRLLWVVSILSFFISALLDNIAAAVVMVALLRKLVQDRDDRKIYACMVIVAANAGGSWSPIGDVTTILLWSSGNITAAHQILSLFVPAALTMIVPVFIAQRFFPKHSKVVLKGDSVVEVQTPQSKRVMLYRTLILIMGVLSLALVPVFKEITHLPPFMGVLCGLTVLWIFTDVVFGRVPLRENSKMSVVKMFSRIDMATIMFFFGVLMSVAAIDTAGQLERAGAAVSEAVSEPLLISFIVGLCSSFVDNVALVAATMGMYPLADVSSVGVLSNFVVNGDFWIFLAYCGVTGGSILIIGSATGVTVMGMEKITFGYYLKNITFLAFIGYLCGAGTYLLINMIF